MVYNGLNQSFAPADPTEAKRLLSIKLGLSVESGYILHVGGNAWYKNRIGVIEIYNAWRSASTNSLPLLLIGQEPDPNIKRLANSSPFKKDIHFLADVNDDNLRIAYNGATVFLFPSIAEGFGWPIAEAMASGCPVITTRAAPMTEVAGDAGFFIAGKPLNDSSSWAKYAAKVVEDVVNLSPAKREFVIKGGLKNVERFNPEMVLDKIETIYSEILNTHDYQ